MPELPEVECVAAALRAELLGRRLDGIRVLFAGALRPSPRAVRRAVVGRRLVGVQRHGKYVFLDFADELGRAPAAQLLLHLRMTGQVFVMPDYAPDRHLRLVLDFEGRPVHYRDLRKFGGFSLLDGAPGRAAIPHVGPDMLEISRRDWLARIGGRRAPLKTLLLDQGIAAGLGNIYADEALFLAGLHPLTGPGDLDEAALAGLWRACRRVLRRGVRHGGTTFSDFLDFTGRPGRFRELLAVYGREGENCRTCDGTIERLRIGGRSSHFCPACQPAPGPPLP